MQPSNSSDAGADAGAGARILVALVQGVIFALSLGAIAFVVWAIAGFIAMGSLPENMGLGLGYMQMGLIPLAGIAGAMFGFVLGVIPFGRALKRWLVGAATVIGIAVIVNGALALLLRP
jgi:hypothetical protein